MAPPAMAEPTPACRQGESGRLLRHERVASYPTAASVQAYFDEWIAFYQDFYHFPPKLPETFEYGFDSYKVTYCTTRRDRSLVCCRLAHRLELDAHASRRETE
jgi:hypothetical protein